MRQWRWDGAGRGGGGEGGHHRGHHHFNIKALQIRGGGNTTTFRSPLDALAHSLFTASLDASLWGVRTDVSTHLAANPAHPVMPPLPDQRSPNNDACMPSHLCLLPSRLCLLPSRLCLLPSHHLCLHASPLKYLHTPT